MGGLRRSARIGWVAEWTKAAVLKTAVPLRVPRVRIPAHPLSTGAERDEKRRDETWPRGIREGIGDYRKHRSWSRRSHQRHSPAWSRSTLAGRDGIELVRQARHFPTHGELRCHEGTVWQRDRHQQEILSQHASMSHPPRYVIKVSSWFFEGIPKCREAFWVPWPNDNSIRSSSQFPAIGP